MSTELKKYQVNVCRIAYGNQDIVVEARNPEEAECKAEDEAGNYSFSEHTSEYKAQGALEIDPDVCPHCNSRNTNLLDELLIGKKKTKTHECYNCGKTYEE